MDTNSAMTFDNPEILSGIQGIDWRNYVPSGGYGWHREYTENLLPDINQALAELKRVATGYGREKARLASIGKCIKEAQRLAERVDGLASGGPLHFGLQLKINEWLAATARLRESDCHAAACGQTDVSELNEDIDFLSAFKDYVETDFMLDRILYALYQVEDRFKMKLFRSSLKLKRRIDNSRAILKNSRSPLGRSICNGGLAKLFAMMDVAYGQLSIWLKKMKKLIDRQGVSALDATELAGMDIETLARQSFSGTAA